MASSRAARSMRPSNGASPRSVVVVTDVLRARHVVARDHRAAHAGGGLVQQPLGHPARGLGHVDPVDDDGAGGDQVDDVVGRDPVAVDRDGGMRVDRGDAAGVHDRLVLADLVEEGALPVEVVQLVRAGLGEQEVLDTEAYQRFHGRASRGAAAGDEHGHDGEPGLGALRHEAAVARGQLGVEGVGVGQCGGHQSLQGVGDGRGSTQGVRRRSPGGRPAGRPRRGRPGGSGRGWWPGRRRHRWRC